MLRKKTDQSRLLTNCLAQHSLKIHSKGIAYPLLEQCFNLTILIYEFRLMWIAYLEFTHNTEVGDLTWDKVQPRLLRTEKLCNMIRSGIPHSLRPQIWMRLSGALEKKMNSDVSYKEIVRASSNDHLMVSRQIEKDLLRTLPSNACFSLAQGTGIARCNFIFNVKSSFIQVTPIIRFRSV